MSTEQKTATTEKEKANQKQNPIRTIGNGFIHVKNCIGSYNTYKIKEVFTPKEHLEICFVQKRRIENGRSRRPEVD